MADLSDDDLLLVWRAMPDRAPNFAFARAAIAADRALNAPAQAAAEPVAWRVPLEGHTRSQFTNGAPSPATIKYWRDQGIELEYAYAAPPQQAAPVAPAVWRMVPVEPTYHMLRESLIPAAEAARYYARMLAAAPQPASELPNPSP